MNGQEPVREAISEITITVVATPGGKEILVNASGEECKAHVNYLIQAIRLLTKRHLEPIEEMDEVQGIIDLECNIMSSLVRQRLRLTSPLDVPRIVSPNGRVLLGLVPPLG